MKIFGRFFLFVLTFVLGTMFTQQIASSDTLADAMSLPTIEEPARFQMESSLMPDGVSVAYAGMQTDDKKGGGHVRSGPYLKFIVYNGTDAKVGYTAKGASYDGFPEVLIDENKQPETYRCLSGAEAFSIEPKMSAEIRVRASHFDKLPKKNAMIRVGVYIRDPRSDFGTETYSESFFLPEPFRNAIKEWLN